MVNGVAFHYNSGDDEDNFIPSKRHLHQFIRKRENDGFGADTLLIDMSVFPTFCATAHEEINCCDQFEFNVVDCWEKLAKNHEVL